LTGIDYGAPLADVRVLDASNVIAGPFCATLFERLGADVIKVEFPGRGDGIRAMGPDAARNAFWSFLSQGRRCVTCKLSTPQGADLFKRLAAESDVVIENFRPGTMEKWGLGPDDLHRVKPSLIIVRISGFGTRGPYRDRPGYGTLAEAMGGFAYHTGDPEGPPILPGIPIADPITGLMAAVGALASLLDAEKRSRTGRSGAVVDVNLLTSMAYIATPRLLEYELSGTVPQRQGNRLYGGSPRNAAKCRDGKWVAYSAHSPAMISNVVKAVGLKHDPMFATMDDAIRHGDELDSALITWIAKLDRATVLSELLALGVPVAPINDASDLLTDENLIAREDLVEVHDAQLGHPITVVASPIELDGARNPPKSTGFSIGEHNHEIYGDLLGLTDEELDTLRGSGVI
jgi:crotonobetainyl-CoA:carnitine CoA-transferase CaiB-like acyl-CoA transferase